MRRLKLLFASLGILLCLAPAIPAFAAENVFQGACKDAAAKKSAACQADGKDPLTGTGGVIYRVTNTVAWIMGALSVIMIMVGGFMYITANGDANKIATAKNTVIYAVVGLIVIFMARTIVAFILSRI